MTSMDNKYPDNDLDQLISETLKHSDKVHAPANFKSDVMAKIVEYETTRLSIQYKPLISKKYWILIFLIIAGLVAYGFASGININKGILAYLDLNSYFGFSLQFWNRPVSVDFEQVLSGIQISPLFSVGILAICGFLLINIFMIRKYYLK